MRCSCWLYHTHIPNYRLHCCHSQLTSHLSPLPLPSLNPPFCRICIVKKSFFFLYATPDFNVRPRPATLLSQHTAHTRTHTHMHIRVHLSIYCIHSVYARKRSPLSGALTLQPLHSDAQLLLFGSAYFFVDWSLHGERRVSPFFDQFLLRNRWRMVEFRHWESFVRDFYSLSCKKIVGIQEYL